MKDASASVRAEEKDEKEEKRKKKTRKQAAFIVWVIRPKADEEERGSKGDYIERKGLFGWFI